MAKSRDITRQWRNSNWVTRTEWRVYRECKWQMGEWIGSRTPRRYMTSQMECFNYNAVPERHYAIRAYPSVSRSPCQSSNLEFVTLCDNRPNGFQISRRRNRTAWIIFSLLPSPPPPPTFHHRCIDVGEFLRLARASQKKDFERRKIKRG